MSLFGQKLTGHALKVDRRIGFPMVRKILNGRLGNYGRIITLELDQEAGRLRAELDLLGEDEAIEVCLWYELEHYQEGSMASLKSASSSKPWIEALLVDLAVGKEYEVPPKYSELVESLA